MTEKTRIKPIPEFKKTLVAKLAEKIKNSPTVLLASTRGLPASQFQAIKKKLRGKAEITVAKKTLIQRAILATEKGALQNLKPLIQADTAIIFSGLDSFELASLLVDNQTPAKAKIGDIAPEDIVVEPGPTDLMPGPAISELGSVGLKVAVENGKLSIKDRAVIAKENSVLDAKVISVMGKLDITPMRVGFIPIAAYDARSDQVFTEIKIDKAGTLAVLQDAISRSLSFAVSVSYAVRDTISYLLGKAVAHEKALEKLVTEPSEKPAENQDNNDKEVK